MGHSFVKHSVHYVLCLVSIIVPLKEQFDMLMEKLDVTGSVADQKPAACQRSKSSTENIAAVRESVRLNPEK